MSASPSSFEAAQARGLEAGHQNKGPASPASALPLTQGSSFTLGEKKAFSQQQPRGECLQDHMSSSTVFYLSS